MTMHEARLAWARVALPWVLLGASLLLFAVGFIDNAMWRAVSLGSSQLVWLLVIAAAVAGLLARLTHRAMATALLFIGALALVYFAGVRACASVALVVLAALGVGSLLTDTQRGPRAALATLVGLGLLCGLDGWLLPFRIHFRAVYLVALLGVVAWRWRAIAALLRPVPGHWSAATEDARVPAALAMLVIVVASAWAWLPTTTYDALAYHVALPSQLAQLGYYQMNVGSNVWALAAWAGDVVQGLARVIGGRDARGPVDVAWFALASVFLWHVCAELALSRALRWLAMALFAALPLTMFLLHSMQAEGPTVALVLGLAWLILAQPRPDARGLVVFGVLFGMLLGLKISNLWFAGPLGLWWLWRSRAHWPWRWLPLAAVAGLAVAGSSYTYAWVLTGNPVLPLFNGWFRSPWFAPVDFHDPRWYGHFDWAIVWNLVFHPGHYIEDGSMGPLVLVALAGCFVVALARPRVRGLALVGLAALLLPLWQIQYLRYAYPAVALLIPVLVCGLPEGGTKYLRVRGAHVVAWVLVAISFVFAGSGSWQVKTGALGLRLSKGTAGVIAHYAPVRLATAAIRAHQGPAARVLMLTPETPFAAELAGRAFVTTWYDPQLSALAARARGEAGPTGWLALVAASGANMLVTRDGQVPAHLQQAIAMLRGERVFARAGFSVWRLPAQRVGRIAPAAFGWHVDVNTTHAPAAATFGQAFVQFACNGTPVRQSGPVVQWQVVGAFGRGERRQHLACGEAGVARASVYFQAPGSVTQLRARVDCAGRECVAWRPQSAAASLRPDLMAERNQARRLQVLPWPGPSHGHALQWITP